jgi:hypothetical protein
LHSKIWLENLMPKNNFGSKKFRFKKRWSKKC